MSAPPQLIHIKRKRGDEDAPVTYLQLEPGSKRHLAGSSWVYQRRLAKASARSAAAAAAAQHPSQPSIPVIQTSKPGDEISSPHRPPHSSSHALPTGKAAAAAAPPRTQLDAQKPLPQTASDPQRPQNPATEPRRFHMSRSAMSSPGGSTILKAGGVSKRGRYGTAVFVERGKKKSARRAATTSGGTTPTTMTAEGLPADVEMKEDHKPAPKKPLAKRPPPSRAASGATTGPGTPSGEPQRKPMPGAAPTQDMSKIAADMDQWVLHEIGLNLQAMEQQQPPRSPSAVASPSRFKPKAPAKRFAERHPEMVKKLNGGDEAMTEASDDEDESDDDYVIEVYELAPSKPVLAEIPPEQIGVLRFDSQEDLELFYGNEDDDSDLDDDEDENAENHYTADYPEDEVDSEDEYDRHAYLFRNANASDEEEFDTRDPYEDDDDDMYVMEGDERRDEDDVFQDKIRRYIRQHGDM
ncbi:hypothetical protein HER10_EVM0007101 [Colletotrichum scovillei]|uniref:Histone H4 n=1 Tax=Colletotrichum scovillei TaxID=1209932 RepID=A0A9P7UG20_9PEZI|nr:uncharacterized protein HER10_EVM0007101 [Colletotrichum scovillei]KAF4783184.1 hypothetical protein HER10_EVM0007101 [Colletotrichum scovillei]KAG7051242.1 histone H4 [Colletotrichum scovillei]KAG7070278.1 histone H4 [Colletotrichum scovillei]KAG7078528.1 histone H4 [Colletotrichum scovillei]